MNEHNESQPDTRLGEEREALELLVEAVWPAIPTRPLHKLNSVFDLETKRSTWENIIRKLEHADAVLGRCPDGHAVRCTCPLCRVAKGMPPSPDTQSTEAPALSAPPASHAAQGCACRWDADDKRVATCERHQGWLDVIAEWADRARAAEAKRAALSAPPAPAEPKAQAALQWPASADEGMLRAMLGWRECDQRDGLTGEADMMERAYHSLYSYMRDKGAK